MSIDCFVPKDQPIKLPLIREGAPRCWSPRSTGPQSSAPSDQENVEFAEGLGATACARPRASQGPGAVASRRLADALIKLADADEATRENAQNVFIAPLKIDAGRVANRCCRPARHAEEPAAGDRQQLEGQGRVDRASRPCRRAIPTTTTRCAGSPRRCSRPSRPRLAGRSRSSNPGDTVVRAFIHAGAWALVVISLPALAHAAPLRRRADDAGAAAGGRRRDARNSAC